MAEIPLRSYIHEIEQQIESGLTDQAVAHCKHILDTYPRCVDIYRMLAKAYLERQRFTDAGDIFQRVLSSIPDDFVSQVGMSIIREDEGNLDEAIWHIERAFEVQPSNNVVQDELRRLYGRRDNVEPPKIRLTRGALARLYKKGELFQQAVGEIRAALNENPNRLDLQTMLAEILMQSDQPAEAAEVALGVLRKLPNCLVANRVMIQVLTGTDRDEEIKTYQQRLAQLDPYAAFAPQFDPNPNPVPDQAVMIEKLDWKPETALSDADQPAWAAALGVAVAGAAAASDEKSPEWLEGAAIAGGVEELAAGNAEQLPIGAPDQSALEEVRLPDSEASDTEIPDWMKEGGWEPAAGISAEGDQSPGFGEAGDVFEPDDQIVDAEIPDWLADIAPSQEIDLDAEPAAEEDLSPWLAKLLPDEDFKGTEEAGEGFLAEPESEIQLPDWLIEEIEPPEGEGRIAAAVVASNIPEWLPESDEFPAEPVAETPSDSSIPGWLLAGAAAGMMMKNDELSAEEIELESSDEIPDWLMEPEDSSAGIKAVSAAAVMSADAPDWGAAMQKAAAEEPILGDTQPTRITAAALPVEALEGAPAEPADEEILETPPADILAEPAREEQPLETPSVELPAELPEPMLPTEPAPDTDELQAAFAWLLGLEAAAEAASKEETLAEDAQISDAEILLPPQAERTALTPAVVPAELEPPLTDEDAAFAWLESLAVKQGAEEALLVKPEERVETMPDWIQQEVLESGGSQASPEMESGQEAESQKGDGVGIAEIALGAEAVHLMTSEQESPEAESADLLVLAVEGSQEKISGTESAVDEWLKAPETQAEFDELPVELLTMAELQVGSESIPAQEQAGEPIPDLPDWLAEVEAPPVEELDWTPPPVPSHPLDINEASLAELERLPGIGFIAAQQIVAYRDEHGAFENPEGLLLVPEITRETLDGIRSLVCTQPPSQPALSEQIEQEFTLPEIQGGSAELSQARLDLSEGRLNKAMDQYAGLIHKGQELDLIAADLQASAQRFPNEVEVWQNFGDALMRLGKVQEAIQAFIKAEQLIG